MSQIKVVVQIPNAHPLGVTAVSWAPAAPAGSLIAAKGPGQAESRFASSGADNTVKVPTLEATPMHGQHACLDRQGNAVLCSHLDVSRMQTLQRSA